MQALDAAKQDRIDKLNKLIDSCEKEHQDIEKQLQLIRQQKRNIAQQHGNTNVDDTDLIEINVRGKIITATRQTLTQLGGTMMEALFSGRWDKKLQRDEMGRIFLDMDHVCFQSIVDYLSEKLISSHDNPPSRPHVDKEHEQTLAHMIKYFEIDYALLHVRAHMLSSIVDDLKHVTVLYEWLTEDGLDGELELLYRASRDGWGASDFHEKCDGKGDTVTVIKSTKGFVFGGFADTPWSTGRLCSCVKSPKAFLFALEYFGGFHPTKIKLNPKSSNCAVLHNSDSGPTFGHCEIIVRDNANERGDNGCVIGSAYPCPEGHDKKKYLNGSEHFQAAEVEVFQLVQSKKHALNKNRSLRKHRPKKRKTSHTYDHSSNTVLPDTIKHVFEKEQDTIALAKRELEQIKHNLEQEQGFIKSIANGSTEDIVKLDVSGTPMAVKRSTLRLVKESVLARQFDDTVWDNKCLKNAKATKEWNHEQVIEWANKHDDMSDDVIGRLKENPVNGKELLALEREDLKEMGIIRTGSLALVMKAIKDLRRESEGDNVTFIEHSPYCFGKIVDWLRLKAMLQDTGAPLPQLYINGSEKERFWKIVEFYFPGDLREEFCDKEKVCYL